MTAEEILESLPELSRRRSEKIYMNKEIENISLSKGELRSKIKDGEDYFQKIIFKGNEIVDMNCTCSSSSNICHHLGALLLVAKNIEETGLKTKKSPKIRAKTANTELKEVLLKASKEELIEFILSLRSLYKDIPAIINRNFINDIDINYIKEKKVEIENYAKANQKSRTKDNYKMYLDKLIELHIEAKENLKARNYLRSTLTYLLLYENCLLVNMGINHMITSTNYMDISHQGLNTLSEKKYTRHETSQIFDYLKTVVEKNTDKPEIISLLRTFIKFIKTEEDYDTYYDILVNSYKNMKPEALRHALLHLEYDLLKLYERKEEARDLVRENPDVPYFRLLTIKYLIDNRRIEEALRISIIEEENSGYNWDRLISIYYLQLSIFKAINDRHNYITRLIKLLQLGEYKAYPILKNYVEEKEFELIYKKIKKNDLINSNPKGIYQRILIAENDKEEMLALIKKFPHMIKEYYDFVSSYDRETSTGILKDFILKNMIRVKNRNEHEEIIRLIQKLYIQDEFETASTLSNKIIDSNPSNVLLHDDLITVKENFIENHMNLF